mmetsp:Transcript_15216/g.26588  ORF Transcript_15216/g.26588 Transcript_15216/m.26588 type:complete len:295 (+) Transcript_15216:296-1180(+)
MRPSVPSKSLLVRLLLLLCPLMLASSRLLSFAISIPSPRLFSSRNMSSVSAATATMIRSSSSPSSRSSTSGLSPAEAESAAALGEHRLRLHSTLESEDRVRVRAEGAVISWAAALRAMRTDSAFQDHLSQIVREAPWEAIFFETKPTSGRTAHHDDFEFVLVRSDGLEEISDADLYTFREQLADAAASADGVVAFPNLGRDAVLVVPGLNAALPADCFRHLGPFIRAAEDRPVLTRAIWRKVADAMTDRLHQDQTRPAWLSTSGLGVYYLHFRIDDKPKYYTYKPFKTFTSPGL